MARHKGRVQAAMIGVGAAFDYHAGTITRAPVWMQNTGFVNGCTVCLASRVASGDAIW